MGELAPAEVFSALGDPVRLRLVTALSEGDATVGDLAAPFNISVQAVSKHLKVLASAGIVRRTSGDYRAPVQLNAEVLSMAEAWLERFRRATEARYQRLDDVLASMDASNHLTTDEQETA